MCLDATTSTKHIAHDVGCTCLIGSWRETYHHHSVSFHAAYLTATIDVTTRRAITDSTVTNMDIRSTGHHGFSASEGVGSTLTSAKYLTTNRDSVCCSSHACISISSTFLRTNVHISVTDHINLINRCTIYGLQMISADISQITSTIDVANDIGTSDCFSRKGVIALTILNRISAGIKNGNIHILTNHGTNIDSSRTFHTSQISTTEDAAIDMYTILCISTANLTQLAFDSKLARHHIDVHLRVAIDYSVITITATKYFTDTGTRVDIYLWICIRRHSMVICNRRLTKEYCCTVIRSFPCYINRCFRCSRILVTIY